MTIINCPETLRSKEQYQNNNVINYLVVDDFLETSFAQLVATEHRDVSQHSWIEYSHYNQKKFGVTDVSLMGLNTRNLIEELSSAPFMSWLCDVTGFNDLVFDYDLDRGGLHRIERGGFLKIHTDERSHVKHMDWMRCINMLLFLSPDYQEFRGGNLDLWDNKKRTLIESIQPKFNRCVIFGSDENSFHGHPTPLNCPENSARRSLALYYFQKSNKTLPLTPTTYIALPEDKLKRKLFTKLNTLGLYCYAVLKRYTRLDDNLLSKMRFRSKK